VILPVAFAIRGAVAEQLSVGADIDIELFVVAILALVEVAVAMRRSAITDHPINVALFQSLRDRCRRVAGIDAHRADIEPEPLPLPVQTAQIRNRVVYVGRRHMRVGDDGVAPIHGAMIQIEEPLRLTVPHHVAGVLVGAAHFDLFALRLCRLRLQRRLAVCGAIFSDGRFQRRQILLRLHLNLRQVVLVLVGVGLQMRRVGVEHRTRGQTLVHRQQHDPIEDLLIDRALGKTPAAVLAQRRCIRHLVAQLQPKEPAVGHVHLHLPHQLTLRTHPVQIPQQQQLEQHHRIKCRTTVVLAVKMLHPIPDKTEIHRLIDLPQQVLLRHKRPDRYPLQLFLLQLRFLQHDSKIQKAPVENESLS
jgi:hypothetical protein